MNENIDLIKILKNCPEGWKFWSPISGEIEFYSILENYNYPIVLSCKKGKIWFSKEGLFDIENEGAECLIFPSKDQRDWSKFSAPWYKKEKFDPKTLKSFDKVLVRDNYKEEWSCNFLSHISNDGVYYPYITLHIGYKLCIPYNEDTKHLVGTTEEAPEYYRYWED